MWHASCLLPESTQSKASRVEGTFYSPHHSLNFTIRGGHGVDKQPNGGCIVWFRFNRKGRSRGLLKTVSRPHRSNNVLKKTKKLLRRTIFSHIVNIIWDFIVLEKSGSSHNQSYARLNPIETWSVAFSRALGSSLVSALSSDWFPVIVCYVLISLYAYWFSSGFRALMPTALQPFNLHEWPRQNFYLQFLNNIKQKSDENKESYQLGDY